MAELADALDLESSGMILPCGFKSHLSHQKKSSGSSSAVERLLAKQEVAGSNPVARSIRRPEMAAFFDVGEYL